MLVKKKNPDWFPSENNAIKVGETIEITDPKALILLGDVIGLADDGTTELSAYELYGVMVEDELKGYQEYIKLQKAEAQKVVLEKQQVALEAQVKASETAKPEEKPETKKGK